MTPHPAGLPAAVLWDMDGTLVDTEPYWFASERDLVESFGHEWPDHHAKAVVGFDLLDSARYIQEHGHVPLPAEEIVERMLDGVIARLHRRIPWRPGARELLAELNAAGVPCALVTMSWRRFVDPIVAALPHGSFEAIVTGDEIPQGVGKPDPEPYLRGAAACGVHPRRCVAIEDSPTGVRSALAAGCRVIGVPNVKELEPRKGLAVIASLDGVRAADLLAIVHEADAAARRARPAWWPARFGELSIARGSTLVVALVAILGIALVVAASRSGDDTSPSLPSGAVPIDVWAPYWTLGDTVLEADERFDSIRELSMFWFGARGVDEIAVDENVSPELASQFFDLADNSQARLVPSIRDEMPAGEMAAILADPTTRSQHVATIVEFADELDADGIDLDYEQFAFADGAASWPETSPNWVAFVEELAEALHAAGRTLTVTIPPVYDPTVSGDRGYWVYDHGAIAEHADAIRIMAYDYSVAEPGPIAPLPWVSDAVAGTSLAVPEEFHDKLVLGVPSYGSNWVVSTVGECPASAEGRTNVTARTVADLAMRRGGLPAYDQYTGEWSFSYALTVEDGVTSCVQNRKVHWVDAEGVADRVEIARRAGWGGVALWALGYEDAEVWQALIRSSREPLDTVEGAARSGEGAGRLAAQLRTSEPETAAPRTRTATLVRTTPTSTFPIPSPDPSGIAWIRHQDRLLLSDAEVDEILPLWNANAVNLYPTSYAGELDTASIGVAIPWSGEPTGLGYDPVTRSLFVTDDQLRQIIEVRAGDDDRYGTSDDGIRSWNTAPTNTDPEDITFDTVTGDLWVVDGATKEVYRYAAGPDLVFGTADDPPPTRFDTAASGLRDPEGIIHYEANDTLLVLDSRSERLHEFSKTGTLLSTIDISAADSVKPAGVALAPPSDGGDALHLYVVDRGIDNDVNPIENDGRIYEMSAGLLANQPTVVDSPVVGGGSTPSSVAR